MDLKYFFSFLALACTGTALAGNGHTDFLSPQWSYISIKGDVKGYINKIPANTVNFTLDNNFSADLDIPAGSVQPTYAECIVYNEFTLDKAAELGLGMGADWWFDVYLNGKMIFSTGEAGNVRGWFSYKNHLFTAKGKKGKNLLAVYIRRGRSSHIFCARNLPLSMVDPTSPVTVSGDVSRIVNKIKIMNAGSGGPVNFSAWNNKPAVTVSMQRWREMRIPYVRNHDVAHLTSYGGPHIVDVHMIFPDFSKDPTDPASYDFTLTDRYMQWMQQGNSKVFYRLGASIEHEPKKYGTVVPPDYHKWAVICEHIIRHYNEGWANGFRMGIEYWEIWNEPDLSSGAIDKKTWQGTDEQFFEFYRTAATYLKKRFPKLKIGGPAVAGREPWIKRFLQSISRGERVPLDFFSWHIYTADPESAGARMRKFRAMLDSYGYKDTESILNEWNYVRTWNNLSESRKVMDCAKGAAFVSGVMCVGQNSPLDMLMYYGMFHNGFWNGTLKTFTHERLKTFYSFIIWAKLADLGKQFALDPRDKVDFYAVGATDGKGKTGLLLVRYTDNDKLPGDLPVTVKIKGADLRTSKVFLLDDEHDLKDVVPFRITGDGALKFSMKANTVVYIEN